MVAAFRKCGSCNELLNGEQITHHAGVAARIIENDTSSIPSIFLLRAVIGDSALVSLFSGPLFSLMDASML